MKKLAPWNDPEVRWVCEEHQNKEFDHRIGIWPFRKWCGGPGMPEDTKENREKGYIQSTPTPLSQKETEL